MDQKSAVLSPPKDRVLISAHLNPDNQKNKTKNSVISIKMTDVYDEGETGLRKCESGQSGLGQVRITVV